MVEQQCFCVKPHVHQHSMQLFSAGAGGGRGREIRCDPFYKEPWIKCCPVGLPAYQRNTLTNVVSYLWDIVQQLFFTLIDKKENKQLKQKKEHYIAETNLYAVVARGVSVSPLSSSARKHWLSQPTAQRLHFAIKHYSIKNVFDLKKIK